MNSSLFLSDLYFTPPTRCLVVVTLERNLHRLRGCQPEKSNKEMWSLAILSLCQFQSVPISQKYAMKRDAYAVVHVSCRSSELSKYLAPYVSGSVELIEPLFLREKMLRLFCQFHKFTEIYCHDIITEY